MSGRDSQRVVLIALAAAAMVAADLGGRILATNDEARFALLAQDMLGQGAWLHPSLNGVPYHNKPLLLAWLIALCSWPLGHVTQLTAVLPSAAAAIGVALLVWALGRAMFGENAARVAALVTITTQGVFLHARLPMPDMLMTFFVTASLWMFWLMARGASTRYWLGFYAFTAAAFWSKGPAGLLPLAVALAWGFLTREEGWRRLRLIPGLTLLIVLVAPWWLTGLMTSATAVRRVVVIDQLQWWVPRAPALSTLVAPLQNVVGILFPWVLILPLVLAPAVRHVRRGGAERNGVLFLMVWSVVTVTLVGLSNQQRLRYYLPLVPAVSLLVGRWWTAGAERILEAITLRRREYGTVGGLLMMTPMTTLSTASLVTGPWPVAVLLLSALTIVTVAVLDEFSRDRIGHVFAVAWVTIGLLFIGGYHWSLADRNAANDYPRLGARLAPLLNDHSLAGVWGVPNFPLVFYFGREVAAVKSAPELRTALAGDRRSIAIVTDAALAELPDHERFRVLMRDRLASRPISVVSYAAGP